MNERGLIALMDAMIFVVLISVISITMVGMVPTEEEYEGFTAGEICEALLSTDASGEDYVPDMGGAKYTLADAIVYNMVTESSDVRSTIVFGLKELTMGLYDYHLILESNGQRWEVKEGGGVPQSTFAGIWATQAGDLWVSLTIY